MSILSRLTGWILKLPLVETYGPTIAERVTKCSFRTLVGRVGPAVHLQEVLKNER